MRITEIHMYPVKGCHGIALPHADVEPWGLAGDRRFMPVGADGVALTQREAPELTQLRATPRPGGLTLAATGLPDLLVPAQAGELVEVAIFGTTLKATRCGDAASAWLSELLGRPVNLVYLDDPTRRQVRPDYSRPGDRVAFADGFPVMLASAASLGVVNEWIVAGDSGEPPVPMTRFRPNLVFEGAPAWAEDAWIGHRLRIGEVVFRAVKACGRCVIVTNDQETGERGVEPLRSLGQHRRVGKSLPFGIQLIPDTTGRLAVGEEITLLD